MKKIIRLIVTAAVIIIVVLLFIWDVIFGTAKITRKYPSKFGAWNQLKEPWYVQLFFPLISSKNPKSELYSIKTNNDYDPSSDYKEFTK